MKSLSTLALVAAGALLAQPALAQLNSAELGLSFRGLDVDSLDNPITGATLSGLIDYGITPQFGVQAGAAFDRLEYEEGGDTLSLDTGEIDLHAYYRFGSARVGAFVARHDVSDLSITGLGSIDPDVQFTTYGIEGDYTTGALTVGGHLGTASIDDLDDVDTTLVGANAAYALNDKFALLAAFDWTKLEESGSELTVRDITFGGEYYVQPNLAVRATIGSIHDEVDGLGGEDAVEYGIGVTYVFGAGGATRNRPLGTGDVPF